MKRDLKMPLDGVRWRLARLWLLLAGLIILILIVQSATGKYAGKVQNVWSWALPTIMPTLSLIVTVLGANALEAQPQAAKVRRSFYLVALWLSAIYLILVLCTITLDSVTTYDPLELLTVSNLWLGPLQGVVASSIAVLFFTKQSA
jgi:hypothetical protein